jgi:hypothetical protein
MDGRVFLAYLVVVLMELTVGIIFGLPWWVVLIAIVLTTAAWVLAAWLGFTRSDSGRHLAAKPGEAHRGKHATLGGWLHDTLWRNQRSDTGEIDVAGPQGIESAAVDDETTEIDLESTRRNPGE